MANRFWINGTGNWSDTSHWSSASGGVGGASLPTSVDNVFFDANSFTGIGQSVSIDSFAICKNIDWTGVLYTPTWAGSAIMRVYGDLIITNEININCYTFDCNQGTSRVMDLGSSTINCLKNVVFRNTPSGLVLDSGTSKFIMSGDSSSFKGGTQEFYNLELAGDESTILDSNTFNSIIGTPNKIINFEADETQTVNSINMVGTEGNLITLKSTVLDTPYTLFDTTGVNEFFYCSIQDCTATGGATWKAKNWTSVDEGGNTGILWPVPPVFTVLTGSEVYPDPIFVSSDIKHSEVLTSTSINSKFGRLYGTDGVISGFYITPWISDMKIRLSVGVAVIGGVYIEELSENDITISPVSGGDVTKKLVMKYNHELSLAEYNIVATSYIVDETEIILAEIIIRDGATLIDEADITLSEKILHNLAHPIETIYDFDLEALTTDDKDSLAGAINEVNRISGIPDITELTKEVASLKLSQAAGQRVEGTGLDLFGTDFTNDLRTTRDTTSSSPNAPVSSGQNSFTLSGAISAIAGQEITIEEGSNIERKIISTITGGTAVVLSSNLSNSYTTSAIVYRSDNNSVLTGQTKDIRISISSILPRNAVSLMVICSKQTNLTYTAYASIVSGVVESYTALTLVNTIDFGDNTQELTFVGEVVTQASNIDIKINVVNTSGSTATITKILGALE